MSGLSFDDESLAKSKKTQKIYKHWWNRVYELH